MFAFIPLLAPIVTGLMKIAEKKFEGADPKSVVTGSGEISLPSKGSMKKAFVLTALGGLYDTLGVQNFVHDFEKINEKQFFLDICGVMIEHLLPEVA